MTATRSTCIALLVALASMAPALYAQSATDQKLLAAARADQPAVIQSLKDMVDIESGSDDFPGLEKMAVYTEGRLRALGATTRRIPLTNGEPASLVEGVFKGTGKLRIMLIAHMDTVYKPGILELEPYHRDGNQLFGPGIADDKGGIAVILHSLGILKQLGWKDYAQLTVLFNPDEEIGSQGTGSIIAKLGGENDVVLSYEPSPSKLTAKALAGVGAEGVLLNAAGVGKMTLRVQGRAAHAGAAADEGRNALLELAHQIVATRDIAKDVPDTQLNWTMAKAGVSSNQIPASAEAMADVRLTQPGAADKLLAAVQAKVNQDHLIPDTTDEVTLLTTRPIYNAGERGLALAKVAESIYKELHAGDLTLDESRAMPGKDWTGRSLLMVPGTTGGTDAGFASQSGKAAVLEGMGLAGWGYHAKNEYIEVDSIVPRLYLTSRMLMELGKQADAGHKF